MKISYTFAVFIDTLTDLICIYMYCNLKPHNVISYICCTGNL